MTTEPTTVQDLRLTIDRLRVSMGWLWLLVAPGPERRPGRTVDDGQAEVLEARGRSDRAYRELNLRQGLSALAPSAAAARLDVVDAQVAVHGMVSDAARRVAKSLGVSYIGGRTDAVGAALDALEWLTVGGPGRPIVVDGDGDAWRAGALDDLHDNRDRQLLFTVHRMLRRADAAARDTAGVVAEPVRPIEHRCPACRQRSLQLHHEGRDKSRWTVRCVRRSCLCAGPGCGCLKRDRRAGLAHVWTRGEMDGPNGLATAVAIAARLTAEGKPRPKVRASTAGHGGWPERRREGGSE